MQRIVGVAANLVRRRTAWICARASGILLIDGQQIDVVCVVNVARHTSNWVSRFRYFAAAVVLVLRRLRRSIADHTRDLVRVRARPGVVRV